MIKYLNIDAYLVGLKKKVGLERDFKDIETLVLGSSHGQYSYVPKKGEYNLCLPSQDLYYSYFLYKKYCRRLKNLKKIVLFYSVFSPGYEVVKTNEGWRAFHYEQIYEIKPKYRVYRKKLSDKYEHFLPYIKQRAETLRVRKNYRGENPDIKGKNVKRIGKSNPVVRARGALKHNQRSNCQNLYVQKILELSQKYNHKFVLVLAPAHKAYKNALPEKKILFSDLLRIIDVSAGKICLLDFYKRNDFTDEDWWDYDHLNLQGADKFTKLYHVLERC